MIDYYIYHHLGLGDHFICNGLVRYCIKNNVSKSASLVVKHKYFDNVSRMFRDLENLKFTTVETDDEFISYYNDNPAPIVKAGFEYCNNYAFDRSFYDSVKIPFKERWDSWHVERNPETEQKLYDQLNINEDYIFVHDSSSIASYNLKIDSNARQIKPEKNVYETSIFDWMKVIENAKEIHVINSSFVHLIDSMKVNGDLYYHDIHSRNYRFTLKNKWNIKQ